MADVAIEAKVALARRRLTVTALAELLRVDRAHLNLVLNGRRQTSVRLRALIGEQLGPEVAALIRVGHAIIVAPSIGRTTRRNVRAGGGRR